MKDALRLRVAFTAEQGLGVPIAIEIEVFRKVEMEGLMGKKYLTEIYQSLT